MFLSVANDIEGKLHVYINKGNKLYATEALHFNAVGTYIQVVMESIMTWSDPLQETAWFEVTKDSPYTPATARKSVGFTDDHKEVLVLEYDDKGRSRKKHVIEQGSRGIISTTFMLTVVRLFLDNLQATLDAQAGIEYPDHSFAAKYRREKELTK